MFSIYSRAENVFISILFVLGSSFFFFPFLYIFGFTARKSNTNIFKKVLEMSAVYPEMGFSTPKYFCCSTWSLIHLNNEFSPQTNDLVYAGIFRVLQFLGQGY